MSTINEEFAEFIAGKVKAKAAREAIVEEFNDIIGAVCRIDIPGARMAVTEQHCGDITIGFDASGDVSWIDFGDVTVEPSFRVASGGAK